MAQYDGTVLINTKIDDTGLKQGLTAMQKDLEEARQKYDEIINAANSSAVGAEQIKAAYDSLNATIDVYKKKLDEATKKNEIFRDLGGVVSTSDEMRVKELTAYVGELENMAEGLKAQMDRTAPSLQQVAQGTQQVEKETKQAAVNTKAIATNTKEAQKQTDTAASKTTKWEKATKQVHSANQKVNKSLAKSLLQFAKYALGISGAMMLFRKMESAVKEGFNNLSKESEETAQAIGSIKSAFTQLKNSTATMMQPLLMAILPALNAIIEAFTDAFTAIGHFIAAITGQEYVYEAIKVNNELADSANNVATSTTKATKALGAYDKLNVISKSSSTGGSSASGGDATQMFKKTNIKSQIQSFVDEVKEAFSHSGLEGIATIFDGIGKSILSLIDQALGTDLTGWVDSLTDKLADFFLYIEQKIDQIEKDWSDFQDFYNKSDEKNAITSNSGDYNSKQIYNVYRELAESNKAKAELYQTFDVLGISELFNLGGINDVKKASAANYILADVIKGSLKKEDFSRLITENSGLNVEDKQNLLSYLYHFGYISEDEMIEMAKKMKSNNMARANWPTILQNLYDQYLGAQYSKDSKQAGNEKSAQGYYYSQNPLYEVTFDAKVTSSWDKTMQGVSKALKDIPKTVTSMISAKDNTISGVKAALTTLKNNLPTEKSVTVKTKNDTLNGVKAALTTIKSNIPSEKTITLKAETNKSSFTEAAKKMWNAVASIWNQGVDKSTTSSTGNGVKSVASTIGNVIKTLPFLASGAVIPANNKFLAVLGDQKRGTNIEAPLDTIVEAVQKALGTGGNNQPIVLQLDGRTIATAVWNEQEKRYNQGFR